MTDIVLIENISDLAVIPTELLTNKDSKIFSFNLEVHNELQKRQIDHEMADSILDRDERIQLFNKSLEFLSWHSRIPTTELDFLGVSLLKISDSHEFHSFLMPILINFLIIKRIIDKENPRKIIAANVFSRMIQSIVKNYDIETKFFRSSIESKLLWDKITIKYNIGKILVSFTLSKNNYLKLKRSIESILGFFYDFWLHHDGPKKKSIVLLEFNSELFSDFLHAMKNYDGNIILVNQRRSALWNRKAINIVRKSNCKILSFDNFLTKHDKQAISSSIEEYSNKIEKFWKQTALFDNLFQIENCSFWNVIKDVIVRNYSEKLPDFILLVYGVKKLFDNMDVRCIATLNEIGETEKAFLEFNNKKVPTILLEHGFIERVPETKRFDKLSYAVFRDYIAVWGEPKKKYLITEHNTNPNKIIVTGSPRHDAYFTSRMKKPHSDSITVLLAPNPITVYSGLANSELEIKFENTLKEIIGILKKFDNVKVIAKLHQIQIKHNQKIASMIKQIDPTIPIYSSVSVIETINSADVVVVISSESFGTSTMLMESMILGRPTINIVLDDTVPQFTHVQDNAVLTISNNSNIEESLTKIIFDTDFQNGLIKNADDFIQRFLSYRGNASQKFASVLQAF